MKYFYILIFIYSYSIEAQVNTILSSSDEIKNYQIFADQNYSFQQVLNEKLLFSIPKKIRKDENKIYCWLKFKVINKDDFSRKIYIRLNPNIENTLYFFDYEHKKWQSESFGLNAQKLVRAVNSVPIVFNSNSTTTLFVKTKVIYGKQHFNPKNIKIWIKNAKEFEQIEQFLLLLWIATMAVLFLFFIYNLYLYFVFRDKTYINYLTIIFGGILYITAINSYCNVLFSFRFFQIKIIDDAVYYFDFNNIIVQIGILLVITGFIKFTLNYLQLRFKLPFWDKLLIKLNYIFAFTIIIDMIINCSGIVYINNTSVFWINLFIIILLAIMFGVGVILYRKKYKPAKYYLLANAVPLLIMLVLATYFLINRKFGTGAYLLPNLAIVIQTLTFAIALVAKINLLKDELNAKQLEAQILKNENQQILQRKQIIILENEKIIKEIENSKLENTDLKNKLETNKLELFSNVLLNIQKTDSLKTIQKQIAELSLGNNSKHTEMVSEIKSTINNNLFIDANWDSFKFHFEQVNPNYFTDLYKKNPLLTAYEIRLSVYLQLNLSTKEIALLLNIDPASVRKAKMRLNKKMV